MKLLKKQMVMKQDIVSADTILSVKDGQKISAGDVLAGYQRNI